MVGTVALVIVFTLTALAVVLYAAYCEAGEELPCKKSRGSAGAPAAHAGAGGRTGVKWLRQPRDVKR